MGNVTKKSIITGLVWVRGSLGEDQPIFQVVVNKPITLDQGEQIAMILKQSIDEARAQVAAQKPTSENVVMNKIADGDVVCGICDFPGHSSMNCPQNADSDD